MAGRAAGGADTVALFPVATETALGALNVHAVAAHPRVDGLCWGAEDLSAELGATSSRRPDGSLRPLFETVRHLCLLGAAAAGVAAVDAVFTDLRDLAGLRRECEDAAAMGFTGKITVHPDQIEIVNEAFTPTRRRARAGPGPRRRVRRERVRRPLGVPLRRRDGRRPPPGPGAAAAGAGGAVRYRRFGTTGVRVSALGLGTMLFGGPTDEQEAAAIVAACLDAGINHFDTANVYEQGRSEEVLGRLAGAGP